MFRKTAWSLLPDLLIVDGGKGQLAMAVDVLREDADRLEARMARLRRQRAGDDSTA